MDIQTGAGVAKVVGELWMALERALVEGDAGTMLGVGAGLGLGLLFANNRDDRRSRRR